MDHIESLLKIANSLESLDSNGKKKLAEQATVDFRLQNAIMDAKNGAFKLETQFAQDISNFSRAQADRMDPDTHSYLHAATKGLDKEFSEGLRKLTESVFSKENKHFKAILDIMATDHDENWMGHDRRNPSKPNRR